MSMPDWVAAYKGPGKEIKEQNGRFYLYERTTVYDKEKKRAKKISGAYLGRITENGLIPKNSCLVSAEPKPDVEYGASKLLFDMSGDIRAELQKRFPECWRYIYVLALLRIVSMEPFKRLHEGYVRSFLSVELPGLDLSSKAMSGFLAALGDRRPAMVDFMKGFVSGTEYILFNGTRIPSHSDNMLNAKQGYCHTPDYSPQVNLMYAFSLKPEAAPVYYRTFAGNICDVSSFREAVAESGVKDMVVIADKGFGSDYNFKMMDSCGLKYIVPLRRNSRYFNKDRIGTRDYKGTFLFNDRPVWFFEEIIKDADGNAAGKVVTYLDKDLELREQRDYMSRIASHVDGYTEEGLFERAGKMGVLLIRTNIEADGRNVYEFYKKRAAIEESFDVLKNTLEADVSYMQKDVSFEAWAFINHISLMIIYRLYSRMKDTEMLQKFSIRDCIFYLSGIRKQLQGKEWKTTIITKKTAKVLELLGLKV